MSDVVRYPVEDFERVTKFCPSCNSPTWIEGNGSQIDARAVTIGTRGENGFNGAASRYTCLVCNHIWEITFPDNSVFA